MKVPAWFQAVMGAFAVFMAYKVYTYAIEVNFPIQEIPGLVIQIQSHYNSMASYEGLAESKVDTDIVPLKLHKLLTNHMLVIGPRDLGTGKNNGFFVRIEKASRMECDAISMLPLYVDNRIVNGTEYEKKDGVPSPCQDGRNNVIIINAR